MEYSNRIADIRQEKKFECTAAAYSVHALSIVLGISWEDAFKFLLRAAHQLHLMPADPRCVEEMLWESGFVLLPEEKGFRPYPELLEYFDAKYPEEQWAIVQNAHNKGLVSAITRRSGQAHLHTESMYIADKGRVWLYRPDRKDISELLKKRKTDFSSRKNGDHSPKSTEEFQYFQANPDENRIGDCVVRAIAGALAISWDEALDRLAAEGEYSRTVLNAQEIFEGVLRKEGFRKYSEIYVGGKVVTGSMFCAIMSRSYHNGERIFAEVGKNHVVAVLPDNPKDGRLSTSKYRIFDSWDCTGRKIYNYWVQPAAPKKEESPSPRVIGKKIRHPKFGIGTVQTLSDSESATLVEVEFPEAGIKQLSVPWVLKNCERLE